MSNSNQTICHSQFTPRLVAEEISRAIWLGNTPQVIVGLSSLANFALESGHVLEAEQVHYKQPDSMDSAMKVLFQIIGQCAEGNTQIYADLYGLCTQLTHRILHAETDMDLAAGEV